MEVNKRLLIALVLCVFCLPMQLFAQGFPSWNLGNLAISPEVRVGFRSITANVNIPIPFDFFGIVLANQSTLDLRVQNGTSWVGEIGLTASLNEYSAFLSAEATPTLNTVRVQTASEPFWAGGIPGLPNSSVEWQGSSLQWYRFDGGGAMRLGRDVSILAGFRNEQLTIRLSEPVDTDGTLQDFIHRFGDLYSADLQTTLWMPYIGAMLHGPCFRAKLIVTPYTWAQTKVPFRYLFVFVPGVSGSEDIRYTFNKGGFFMEGTVDYNFNLIPGVQCSLWGSAGGLWIRGNADESYEARNMAANISLINSASAVSTYRLVTLAGGLSLGISF
jgi:hypothetical protein